jgi:hypothetical protein
MDIQRPPPKKHVQTVQELGSYVQQQRGWDGGAFLRNP